MNLIEPGWDKSSVVNLLGKPTLERNDEWTYGSDNAFKFGDFAWLEYSIYFNEEGKVISKERTIYYD